MDRRVIVVDSNIAVQRLIEYTLSREGFEVDCVCDSISALDLALNVKPDMIIVSYNPEGMDIYDFCKKIRGYDILKDIPIIVLVGYSDSYDEERLLSAGASCYIKKPIESSELLEKVKKLFKIEERGEEEVKEEISLSDGVEETSEVMTGESEPITTESKEYREAEEYKDETVNIEELLGWSISDQPSSSDVEKEEKETDIFEGVEEGLETEVEDKEDNLIMVEDEKEVISEEGFKVEVEEREDLITEEEVIQIEKAQEEEEPQREERPQNEEETKQEAISLVEEEAKEEGLKDDLRGYAEERVSRMVEEVVNEVVKKVASEMVERIAWEVVPDLAEIAIKKEIEQLTVEK